MSDLQLFLGLLEAGVLVVISWRLKVDIHVIGGDGSRRNWVEKIKGSL